MGIPKLVILRERFVWVTSMLVCRGVKRAKTILDLGILQVLHGKAQNRGPLK